MSDIVTTNESVSESQIAQMSDELKGIFDKKPDISLVKSCTLISGPNASTIWNDVSDEDRRYKIGDETKYAEIIFDNPSGFKDLKFENVVRLGLLFNRMINENEEFLSAPNGQMRVTNLRLERHGTKDDSDWEIRVTTFGEEESEVARQRLDKLVSSIKFVDTRGGYISTFDKFENSETQPED